MVLMFFQPQKEVRSHEPAEAEEEAEVDDTLWLSFGWEGGDESGLCCCCVLGG